MDSLPKQKPVNDKIKICSKFRKFERNKIMKIVEKV